MARIKQFADDLGISYAEAERLVKEGRRGNGRGRQVMNKYMKARDGKSVTGPKARPNAEDRFQLEGGFDSEAYEKALEREEKLEKYMEKAPKRSARLKRRGDDEKVVTAKDGKMFVRGMGKACMRDAKEVKIR
jgi:hypothetical protein